MKINELITFIKFVRYEMSTDRVPDDYVLQWYDHNFTEHIMDECIINRVLQSYAAILSPQRKQAGYKSFKSSHFYNDSSQLLTHCVESYLKQLNHNELVDIQLWLSKYKVSHNG